MIKPENSIVNLSCSISKEFKAPFSHPTISKVDSLINGAYRNVILLVFSGIGLKEMQKYLSGTGYFSKNFIMPLSSVCPAGPVPGNMSLMTGLCPSEHGYIASELYIDSLDKVIDVVHEKDLAKKYLPYETIIEKINRGYVGKAREIKSDNLDDMIEMVLAETEIYRKEYIYSYWPYPEDLRGEEEVKDYIKTLEEKIEAMAKKLSDSILLITSDHGFKDVKYRNLTDYRDIMEMLERPPSLEGRAKAFYVKDKYMKDFPKKFKDLFGNDFELYSKDEVIKKELFGGGLVNKYFKDMIGDYLAIGHGEISLKNINKGPLSGRGHSGLTREEVEVPLIGISKRRLWF
ncbi:MAG: hypothetical protein GX219_06630 [Tissierellia bacterium]|nr:hypothetical protein [Tissierellia bacterium]